MGETFVVMANEVQGGNEARVAVGLRCGWFAAAQVGISQSASRAGVTIHRNTSRIDESTYCATKGCVNLPSDWSLDRDTDKRTVSTSMELWGVLVARNVPSWS